MVVGDTAMMVSVFSRGIPKQDIVKMLVYTSRLHVHERFCFLIYFFNPGKVNDDEDAPHDARKEEDNLEC